MAFAPIDFKPPLLSCVHGQLHVFLPLFVNTFPLQIFPYDNLNFSSSHSHIFLSYSLIFIRDRKRTTTQKKKKKGESKESDEGPMSMDPSPGGGGRWEGSVIFGIKHSLIHSIGSFSIALECTYTLLGTNVRGRKRYNIEKSSWKFWQGQWNQGCTPPTPNRIYSNVGDFWIRRP